MITYEKDIQAKIIKVAKRAGWYALKIIQSNKNGFPDLMLFKAGRVIFIEVKRPGKELRPLQEYRRKELQEQGFEFYVIDSVDQVKEIL